MPRSIRVPFYLAAVLITAPAFAQTPAGEAISELSPAAPEAYVYVGTNKGVDLYDVASTGKLTLVKGSPFQTSGLAIGSNGKYFVSLGTNWVHSYPVTSAGAIGKQVSTINTEDFDGSVCGQPGSPGEAEGTGGAVFDHKGQNVYVLLNNPSMGIGGDECTSIQTFNISKTGALTFNGALITGGNAGGGLIDLPAITGNDTYAYAANFFTCCGGPPAWSGFLRKSSGEMENWTFNLTDGASIPLGYIPLHVAADPTNHLATIVAFNPGPDEYGPERLASFTVNGEGNLTTTSTAKNMPTPSAKVSPAIMNMSPSGKLLAVAGDGFSGHGLEIYHFNGAAPITPYSAVLDSTVGFVTLRWDDNNHLYALGYNNKLYVYTVTPTTIAVAPGSPYTIANPGANALIVVPK